MGDQTFQIRGGIGIFTSRIPWVWPAGAYTNSGVIVGGLFKNTAAIESELPEFTFNLIPYTQYTLADFGGTDAVPQGQLDLLWKTSNSRRFFVALLELTRSCHGICMVQ